MSTETVIPSRIKTTWLLGILVIFSIFAVIAWYSGHMTRAYTGYDQKRTADRYVTLQKLQAEENAQLTPLDAKGQPTAEWVDQGKGIIRIPIEEAMLRQLDTMKAQPAHACSAMMLPPPAAAAPAPAPAASTNAAPAAPEKPKK